MRFSRGRGVFFQVLSIVSASILVPFWRPGSVKNEVFAWEGCIFWRFQALQDEMLFRLSFGSAWDRIRIRNEFTASIVVAF